MPSPVHVDEGTRQLVANRVVGELRAEAEAGDVLPHDFLNRVVTGKSFAFALPDGTQTEGTVELSGSDAQGLLWIQGRLTKPAAGRCFLQRQTVAGVAGPLVGNLTFDGKKEGWKIEPTADLQAARFVPRHEDEIVCANYEKMPVIEEATDYVAPQDHPTNEPLPDYQNVISLQSIPGATGVIYLDFDGEAGPFSGWGNFDAAPSGANNQQIFDVWKMVCEDYQGFNLNITTDRKVFDEAPQGRRQHVMVTPTTTAAPGAGGVAFVGSYNWGGDTVCWAFYTTGKSACEVVSHEVGHTLGLSHDGRNPSEGYYGGHGSGATGWAPIMGVGYYQNLSQWSKGEYANANNLQDDLAIITGNNNDVAYREDDTGDTLATAKYLEIAADNSVSNEGFIGKTGDVDAFRFATSGGQATLNVNTVALNPDLDILAEIVNAATSAVVVSNNPDTGINATVSANLPAGEYLLRVRGTGRGDPLGDGYSNYGSLGTYLISGGVVGGVKPYRFTLAENPANGAVIGTAAARVNHGANPLNWTIASGNDSGGFAINPTTGALTVSDPAVFDYERQSLHWDDPATFELFVSITDSANSSLNEYLRVVVTVTDANDPPRFLYSPYIGRPGTPGVPYNGTLVAVDEDANSAAPTYSKLSGPAWLSVASDGTLTGNPTSAEMGTNTFTVRASDGSGPFSDVTLLIEIVDTAVSPFWNNAAGGSWPVAGNWLGNSIATGSSKTGDFSTLDLTADATVTLDGARTIGGLKFGDTTPSHNWILEAGSGGTLTLAPPSGSPVISVTNQTATINAVLASTQGITKAGAGTAVITNTGASGYTGATVISSGTLTFTTSVLNSTSGYSLNDANTGSANTALRMIGGFTSNRTGVGGIGLRDMAPVTITNNGTGTTTLEIDSSTGNWPNGLVTLGKAVVLKSSGAGGVRSGFVTISGNGAGAGNDSVIYDATGSGNDNNWNTYEQPGTYAPMANSYLGNVRFTGGTTILQNKTYANAAYVNMMIPDTARVTIDAGSGINFAWGSESFDGLNDGAGGGGSITSSSSTVPTISLGVSNGSGLFSGVITSGLSLVKAGTGTQTLAGSNTYSGATAVNGGTLAVTGSLSASSAVTVNSGGTLGGSGTVNGPVTMSAGSTLTVGGATVGTLTLSNTLNLHNSGTVSLRIQRSGAAITSDRLQLTGNSGVSYKGTLNVTSAPGSDALVRGDKFILFSKTSGSFSGSFATLNLPSLDAGLMWDAGGLLVDGSIQVVSSVVVETPSISPGGGNLPGPVPVTIASITSGSTIHYTTDGSDPVTSPTAVSGITPVGVTVPATATMTIKAYGSKAGLADSPVVSASYVTVPADAVTWTNPAGGSWPVSGNWLSNVIAEGTGVTACFDTLNLTADTAVALDGAHTVSGLKFGDTTPSHNWSLNTGSGGPLTLAVASGSPVVSVINRTATINAVIAGSQGVSKSGAGTLTLAAANSYTGGTFANEGELIVKAPANADWTMAGGASTVAAGATLKVDLTPQTTQYRHTTLGTIAVNAGGVLNLNGTVDNVDSHYLIQSWGGATGTGTIRLAGGGSIAIWTGSANPLSGFTGLLDIQSGRIACNINSTSTLGGNFDVNLASAGKLDLRSGHFTIDALDGATGSQVHKSFTGDTIDFKIGTGNGGGNFAGAMVGSNYNVIKSGTGSQIFSGSNTYSGSTRVDGGTLLVNGSLGASSAVTVNTGGNLGGRGTINGAVTVAAGGTLSAGDGALGTLTLANTVTLDGGSTVALRISKSGSTLSADRIHRSGGGLAYQGTLNVTLVSGSTAFAAGDKFTLFSKSSGAFTGGFSALNLPAPGPNLEWNTANLTVDGSIEVTSTTIALTPVFSPGPGNYLGPQSVTISTTTPGASIRYTTDGSDPKTSGTAVTVAAPAMVSIPAPAAVTVSAYALKAGLTDSPVATGSFTTFAADQPIWQNAAGGSWPVASNWLSGVVASGSGITARFDTLDLTADATVTLDGARTVGGLKFADTAASHNWILNAGSGDPLTLAVTSGSPVVSVANQTTTINAVLAGNQGLVKSGTGTLTLGGVNTLTGTHVVSQGTLAVTRHNAIAGTSLTLGDSNTGSNVTNFKVSPGTTAAVPFTAINTSSFGTGHAITLDSGGSLGANAPALNCTLNLAGNVPLTLKSTNTGGHSTAQDWNGRITGTGIAAGSTALVLDGSAYPLRLSFGNSSNPNTFTGDVLLQGLVTTQNQTYSGNIAANQNNGFLLNNLTVVSGGTWNIVWGGETMGALNGQGSVNLNCQSAFNNVGLTLGNTNTNGSFSGVVAGGFGVTKIGTGMQTFAGANTYTGPTGINGGTLLINGSQANTATTVAAAGTLGGTGIIAGSVSNSGTIAPGGSGVGNLTVNNTLTMAPGSKLAWEVSNWTGAAGTGWDKVAVTSLNITATNASRITIRPVDLALANFSETNTSFVIAQTTSGITGFSADKFSVDTTGLTLPHGTWAVQQSGNNLVLAYTAQTNPDANGNGIFDTWEIARFGDAKAGANLPDADPDKDGLSNLIEYALDTHPLSAGASPLVYDIEPLGDGKHLRLTVPKNPVATNLTYTVESCGSLNDWSAATTTIEADSSTQLIVRDNFTTDTASKRFIRLKVTASP